MGRWQSRCLAHDDRHPSLDIREAPDGTVLLICRAGCTQREVIDALRERGLWAQRDASAYRPRAVPFRWEDHLTTAPAVPDCCLAGGCCKHWDEFSTQYLLAHLRGNLRAAIRELIEKLERAEQPITAASLTEGLALALEFGLAFTGLDADAVSTMMALEAAVAVKGAVK